MAGVAGAQGVRGNEEEMLPGQGLGLMLKMLVSSKSTRKALKV